MVSSQHTPSLPLDTMPAYRLERVLILFRALPPDVMFSVALICRHYDDSFRGGAGLLA